MLNRIDDFLFETCKAFILKRVKKGKHKENKYRVYLGMFKKVYFPTICGLVLGLPIFMMIVGMLPAWNIIAQLIWLPVLYFTYQYSNRNTIRNAERYDIVFELRKQPIVYTTMKETLEEIYERDRRLRRLYTGIMFVLFLPSIAIHFWAFLGNGLTGTGIYELLMTVFLALNMLDILLYRYLLYIFDFDDPDTEEKDKNTLTMTDLMRAQFERLVGSLKPMPV